MLIKKITITNFNNYKGTHSFEFKKLNLIKGKNGTGKSTLAVDAVLFALFGYSDRALSSLPTKGVSGSCEVILDLSYKGQEYSIHRKYPTELTVSQNGAVLSLAKGSKQGYLNDLFKSSDYFKKLRMIDVKKGINILEENKASLKKTLVSFNESMINSIRARLLEKKSERTQFNKDTAVIYKHAPSEARLKILTEAIAELDSDYYEDKALLSLYQGEYNEASSELNKLKYIVSTKEQEIQKMKNLNECPTCKQKVPDEHKSKILEQLSNRIDAVMEDIGPLPQKIKDSTFSTGMISETMEQIRKSQQRLNTLKMKLEARLKQREYKWTTKDIVIMKKSIEELDRFYSFYLVESVRTLEPVVNNIIAQIGFQMVFDIDAKGEFEIKLTDGADSYTYQDLSDGQKLILAIAFQVALLMDKGEDGLIIADEGLSSLDAENLEYVFSLFTNIPFQLIAVIHRYDNQPKDLNIIDLDSYEM